jgi:conjugal transfer/entry exclusion protein
MDSDELRYIADQMEGFARLAEQIGAQEREILKHAQSVHPSADNQLQAIAGLLSATNGRLAQISGLLQLQLRLTMRAHQAEADKIETSRNMVDRFLRGGAAGVDPAALE